MSLLLLPLEIFREILELAVVNLGPLRATKLRLVNSECSDLPRSSHLTWSGLFDRETLRAYARTKLLDRTKRGFWIAVPADKKTDFLARYLLERPHTENTPTNGNFAALMNYIVDELVKEDGGGGSEQLRYLYLKTLCRRVMNSYRGIISDIFPKTTDPVSSVENCYHVFIAAIYVGKLSVIQRMLEDKQMDVAEVKSEFFGTPLNAAVKMGQYDLVRVLLQRGADVNRSRSGNSPLELAIINEDKKMVCLLLEPQYGHSTSGAEFEQDLVMSLNHNQPSIARLLLEHITDKLSECRFLLSAGLPAACRHGMIEIVELLLDRGGAINVASASSEPSLVEQAAFTGQEEVLRLLLTRGANPYGRGSRNCSMCAAAWGGHTGAACILLDAGVQLKPRRWVRVLEIAAPRVKSAEMVRLLLDRGIVKVNKLDDDPREAERVVAYLVTRACQQGNVGFVQALAQHGVTMDHAPLYARHSYPPPIIVAMAYRQDLLVRALLELGVAKMDPLDSIIGGDFANGTFPCDPPALPQCYTPWRL